MTWASATAGRSWPCSCWTASMSSRRACAATRGDHMDLNKLTQKTQEALHDAQTKALRFGHTEIDTEHLLLALLDQPEGLVERLLIRAEIDVPALKAAVEQQLERRPRVSGAGSGEPRIART